MAERTPEYQRKASEYTKYLKPYLGNVPELSGQATDQQTYEGLQQLHQRALTKWSEAHGQPKEQYQNIWVVDGGDRLTAMDMANPNGGRIQILDNGRIITDGNASSVLNTLIAMKSFDQSLPDFLKELANGDKKK